MLDHGRSLSNNPWMCDKSACSWTTARMSALYSRGGGVEDTCRASSWPTFTSDDAERGGELGPQYTTTSTPSITLQITCSKFVPLVTIRLTIIGSLEGAAVPAKRVSKTEGETDLARQQRERHARSATLSSTTHEAAKSYCVCVIGRQCFQTRSFSPSGVFDPYSGC